jgi:hypothetical protein
MGTAMEIKLITAVAKIDKITATKIINKFILFTCNISIC